MMGTAAKNKNRIAPGTAVIVFTRAPRPGQVKTERVCGMIITVVPVMSDISET